MINEVQHNGKFSSVLLAVLANSLMIMTDFLNSDGFSAFTRAFGVAIMILTVLNLFGILDPIKQVIKNKLFKK